jgi:pimeloyl-ACP methyl ester carboxylesterase
MTLQRYLCVSVLTLDLAAIVPAQADHQRFGDASAIAVRTATVDGLNVRYLTAGRGPAVVLLHGYAETSRMWRPLIPRLADRFTVIAPDLPGIGESDIPTDGLDMTTAGARMHALIKSLGVERAAVVGHDIGLMVAYAYAAQFPKEVEQLVLMDAFLPGIQGWEDIYNNPSIWHFRFNGPTPEALVKSRERTYFEHFWNDFAADKNHSIPEGDRQAYTAAYSRPGRMRSAWGYFVSFQQAANDFARFSQTKLTMPVLSIGGAKANGDALGKQVKLVAEDATFEIFPNTGHWLMEERQQETIEVLVHFLGTRSASTAVSSMPRADAQGVVAAGAQTHGAGVLRLVSTDRTGLPQVALSVPATPSWAVQKRLRAAVEPVLHYLWAESVSTAAPATMPLMRLTPEEVRVHQTGSEQIGSSGLAGVSTQILFGEPSKRGYYTIVLFVPAQTTIPAHSHRDDRMATVVSGTWQFGYGDRFDARALKSLPVGSVYSEPGRVNHFARTGNEPVLVEISGVGPTDTTYVNPADTPKTQRP